MLSSAQHEVLQRRGVRCWMLATWRDCVFFGRIDAERLAVNAAHAFDRPDWLDDPNHWIWETARTFDPDACVGGVVRMAERRRRRCAESRAVR